MRIALYFDVFGHPYQPYLSEMVEELTKMSSELSLFANQIKNKSEIAKYIPCTELGNRKVFLRFIKMVRLYDSVLFRHFKNFDVIHVQHSYLFPTVVRLKRAGLRGKVVMTLRGGDTYIKPWHSEKWRNFYAAEASVISAFIVQSQHQKKYLSEKWGVPLGKIHVIPISYSSLQEGQDVLTQKQIALPVKLLSVFRMTWEKNILGSVLLASELKSNSIEFVYDIIGDGNDIGQLYYLVDRFGLNKEVNVYGFQNREQVLTKLKDAHFMVQLSISEALSASLLEAQAFGVVPVVSDSDGIPEAVNFGNHGIMGQLTNVKKIAKDLITLIHDADMYSWYSKTAMNYVRSNFSIKHEASHLMSLYHSLS